MAAKDYKRFEPSIDIVNHAQRHLAFLEEVDAIAESLAKPHVIANAVCRYETCWLKLLSKNKGVDLLPPIDVHWAWHVHMLCPRKYAADVTKIAGELVGHEFHLLRHDRRAHESKTKQIWNAMFPDEPFEVDFSTISPSFSYQSTQVTYDIQAASSRQLEFYYNVALPHFSLIPFLQQAEARYAKFMYLKTLNRDAFLVPMYDIDIMWHTHQLAPESYHKDSMAWLGYILNHDDTSTDRSPGSHLNESYANTRKLWRETFKEEYAIPGVGYRGPNPRGKLFKIPDEEIDKYKPQSGQVRLDSITYSNNEKTGKLKGWLKASGYSSGATKITLHEKESEPFKWVGEPPEGILTFELKPYSSCNFEICLRSMKGLLAPLMNGKKVFKKCCDGSNKIMQMLDSDSDHTELTIFDRYKGTAVLSLSVVERKPMSETLLFYLEPSTFETMATIPENVESMWGPVCLPKLPAGVENICHVADHKLVAKKGLLVTVRVIHSLPLNMSVIQVYLKDKLAAISHLIGQDQLPTSTQLPTGDRKWMTLDVKKGERAMLVKNHAGDWAIVKGNWEKNSKTKLGYLNTHVKLQSREQYSNFKVLDSDLKGTRIKRINARESFQFMGTTAELAQEVLHVNCEDREMAEHIATIFSSLVLYTLCEPRRGDAPGADREKNANKRTPAVDPARYKMMKAAGYMTDTPSNSYWWWMWYNNKDSHHYHYYQDHFWDWDEEFYIDSGPDTDRSDNNVCEGDVDNSADTGKGMFCPWDPDNEHDLDELVSDFVSDTDGVIAAACGSCATSSGDNGIGDTGTSSGYDFTSGQDSGFSSCATSSGGGGGGGGGCGSSCGSSCGGGGGGGSSCGGGGGSSCGGD